MVAIPNDLESPPEEEAISVTGLDRVGGDGQPRFAAPLVLINGHEVRRLRLAAGLRQVDVAKNIATRELLSQIELGKVRSVREPIAQGLALALGVSFNKIARDFPPRLGAPTDRVYEALQDLTVAVRHELTPAVRASLRREGWIAGGDRVMQEISEDLRAAPNVAHQFLSPPSRADERASDLPAVVLVMTPYLSTARARRHASWNRLEDALKFAVNDQGWDLLHFDSTKDLRLAQSLSAGYNFLPLETLGRAPALEPVFVVPRFAGLLLLASSPGAIRLTPALLDHFTIAYRSLYHGLGPSHRSERRALTAQTVRADPHDLHI